MKKKIIILFSLITFIFSTFAPASTNAQLYYKNDVGLNVHWALGGFGYDAKYEAKLRSSRTMWVREHFYNEVLTGENQEAWLARYDEIISRYRARSIRVVGMLAYGPDHNDFRRPHDDQWEDFVRLVVDRYGKDIQVWEIWNEPDSPDYLQPNNPETYGRMLEIAYPIIKEKYPNATVLNGGLSWPNPFWAEQLYRDYGNYFDALSIHLYYCEKYYEEGDFRTLDANLKSLKQMIDQYRPGDRVWVTEIGCSTGSSGIDASRQRQYLERVVPHLLQKGWFEMLMLYTIRNRDINNRYENEFGLLRLDMSPRLSWEYYTGIYLGPYDKRRTSPTAEANLAQELRVELEHYLPDGKIPVEGQNWHTLVNAYIYGEYPIRAIVQSIKHHGKTVHPTIPFKYWKTTPIYQEYINRDWTGFAYGQRRETTEHEQQQAEELRELLERDYGYADLRIGPENWVKLVNAYVYGGYPVKAIAKAERFGGKTVHPTIHHDQWQNTDDYKRYIDMPL